MKCKRIQSWKRYFLILLAAGFVWMLSVNLHAEETVDGSYAYQFTIGDLKGVALLGSGGKEFATICSSEWEPYAKPRVEPTPGMKGSYDITVGKLTICFSSEKAYPDSLATGDILDLDAVTPPTTGKYSDKADGEPYSNIDFFGNFKANKIQNELLAYWQDASGILYNTQIDIQLINDSEEDFAKKDDGTYDIKVSGDSSITVSLDKENRKITLKSERYKDTIDHMFLIYPTVAGKKAEWKEKKEGDAHDGSNLREDRELVVSDTAGTERIYTVHMDMPWRLDLGNSHQRNYNLVSIAYGGTTQSNVSTTEKFDDIPAGETVTMVIEPKDPGKVIDGVNLNCKGPSGAPSVTTSGNTFSFVMPGDGEVTIDPVTSITFKAADENDYSLTGEVPQNTNRVSMGTVAFSDEQGNPISIAKAGNTVCAVTEPTPSSVYDFQFTGWEAEGLELAEDQIQNKSITFTMPSGNVKLKANYQKSGTNVTISSPNYQFGEVQMLGEGSYDLGKTNSGPCQNTIKKGAELSFTLESVDISQRCTGWKIKRDGQDVPDDEIEWVNKTAVNAPGGGWMDYPYPAPKVLAGGNEMTVEPVFTARKYAKVTVSSSDPSMGSAGIGGGAESIEFEGDTVTITAVAADRYRFDHWEVTEPAGDGKVMLADSSAAETTFSMIAEPVSIQAVFVKERQSSEKQFLEVVLLDKQDPSKTIGMTSSQGTAYTVTLPESLTKAEAEALVNGGAYLKIRASEEASVAQEGGYDDSQGPDAWSSGKILCAGFTLNEPKNFTVTAEDGSTQAYTITVAYEDSGSQAGKPELKAGNVNRVSDAEAKAVFRSDTAGTYYFRIAESGAAAPQIDTSGAGLDARKGNNTVTLTTLTAGAKDLYVVVKSGNAVSDPLKIEIPAYVPAEKTYKIGLSYPAAGGTLTVSSTEAKAGEEITVTVTPKSGKRLTAGSLKYTESTAGGAVVNIDETTKTFVMPASDISVSCTWEDDGGSGPDNPNPPASGAEAKILTFAANGVSGVINDTTGTITVTLPYGTDLAGVQITATTPEGVSISPEAGRAVDLSGPVTFTVTAPDGSSKTYRVTAYTEEQPKSEALWDKMLENMGSSTDSSGPNTWWEKAKRSKKDDSFPGYW